MRLDGQTVPAPHHYIEALFKQIKYPDLGGYIKFEKLNTNGSEYLLNIVIMIFNFSPLQNEENLSYELIVNKGVFQAALHAKVDDRINYRFGGTQMIFNNVVDVFSYGVPRRYATIIVIKPSDLISNNYEVEFLLNFGGRFSPRKMSEYKIRIDNSLPENSNSLIIFKEENVLMYDRRESKGKGNLREDIDKILER